MRKIKLIAYRGADVWVDTVRVQARLGVVIVVNAGLSAAIACHRNKRHHINPCKKEERKRLMLWLGAEMPGDLGRSWFSILKEAANRAKLTLRTTFLREGCACTTYLSLEGLERLAPRPVPGHATTSVASLHDGRNDRRHTKWDIASKMHNVA